VLARPLATESEDWVLDPTRGWMGYIAEGGSGLAAVFDFQRIRALRVARQPAFTMEWMFRKVDAQTGLPIKTPLHLAAFDGLREISGVGDRLAVSLEAAPPQARQTEAKITVAPFENFTGNLSLFLRPLAGGPRIPAGQQVLAGTVGKPSETTLKVTLPDDNSYVLEGVISVRDMPDLKFEKPIFGGAVQGAYAMAPEAARVPEVPDTPSKSRYKPLDFNFNSTAIPTPHRIWAKPYAGGRPRVLALMPQRTERDAVELAQRFDLDLTCPFITKDSYYVLGDNAVALRMEAMRQSLDQAVDQNYDVIVMSSDKVWPLLTPHAKERIRDMLTNGTGLVLAQRGPVPDELKEFVPLEHVNYDSVAGRSTLPEDGATDRSPLLNALPYRALPAIYSICGSKLRQKDDGSPAGQILLSAVMDGKNRGPLVAIGETGPARVAMALTEGSLIPGYGKFAPRDGLPVTPPFDYWEYQYAMMARLIYWAAHKEAPVSLLGITPSASQVEVKVQSAVSGPATLHLTLRDYYGEKIGEKAQPIQLKSGGEQTFAVPFSAPGQHPYLADVTIAQPAGTLAFGGEIFPADHVSFTALAPAQPVYNPGESAVITATFDNAPPAHSVVRAEVWDGQGRETAVAEAPAAAETRVTVPLAGVIGPWYEVRASLVTDGQIAAQMQCEGKIKAVRQPDRYRAFFWGGVGGARPENVILGLHRLLRSLGINAQFGADKEIQMDARFLRQLNWPYTRNTTGMANATGVTKEQAAAKPVEKGNRAGDPEAPALMRKIGEERGALGKDEDVLIYRCGDENRGPIKDICFSEDSKKTFRRWLQEHQYKTIEELNQEWGTSYGSFDEVVAMTEAEAKAHAQTARTYAPWLDQRSWMNWSMANLAHELTQGVLSQDPHAVVGESGTQETKTYNTARDWWLMSRAYTGLVAYEGTQTTEQISFNPELVRYSWGGYAKPNPFTRAALYARLGLESRGFAIFSQDSHIDPDFTVPECGREARGTLVELQRGIGQLLVSAKVAREPVFVLQSPASVCGSYILGQDALAANSRMTIIGLLGDLGVNYRNISYEQLSQGDLVKNGARILILPYAVAISPAGVEAIRAWVKDGGTLIADLDPALMTEHGRLYPRPELDDVLGLDRSSATMATAEKDGGWEAGPKSARDQAGINVKAVQKDLKGPATPLWKAVAGQEEIPIVFHHPFGRGQAYYLAADLLRGYSAAGEDKKILKADATPEDIADSEKQMAALQGFFGNILADAGIRPYANVLLRPPQNGQPGGKCQWVWTNVKESGATRYVLIQRDYAMASLPREDLPVAAKFAQPGAIYDVIAGQFLGYGDSVDFTMMNDTSRLFAILPSRVTGLEIQPPKPAYQPGETAALDCAVTVARGSVDPRVLRVDVTRPDGAISWAYSTDLILPEGGKGAVSIPFALNDPKGDWKVKVTDVSTGTGSEVKLSLR